MEIQVIDGATKAERRNRISALRPAIEAEGNLILSEIDHLDKTYLIIAPKGNLQKNYIFRPVAVPGFTAESRQKYLATVKRNQENHGWEYVGFRETGLNSPAIFRITPTQYQKFRRTIYKKIAAGTLLVLALSIGFVVYRNYSTNLASLQEVELMLRNAQDESRKAEIAFKKENWELAITSINRAGNHIKTAQHINSGFRGIPEVSSRIEELKNRYSREISRFDANRQAWRATCDCMSFDLFVDFVPKLLDTFPAASA